MILRNLALSVVCAVLACASVVQAAPIFYLSTSNAPGTLPGDLALSGAANSTGTLYLWGNSTDVRVGGVSLDVVSANNSLKFTNPLVGLQAGANWTFGSAPGPTLAADGLSVTRFNGSALPPGADGFGLGSATGPTLLLGSMGYMLGASGAADVSLRVGTNEITDYDGNYPQLRLGKADGETCNGDGVGCAGVVGTATVEGGGGIAAMANDDSFSTAMAFITRQLTATGDTPITFGGLVPFSGNPQGAFTLAADGKFDWQPGPTPRPGTYAWDFTATNAFSPGGQGDVGRLTIELQIPEPATISLIGLAMIGLIGVARRRS
jgi:hypothetical protein